MRGSTHRAATDHAAVAAAARAERGTWMLAGLYPSSMTAKSVAKHIARGSEKYPAYLPGGFEAYAARSGEDEALWIRYVAGDPPVPPLPDRMTVRVCDRGDGRAYVGVFIVTVTISTLCPVCGGPRGWDRVRPHRFCEDGEWLSVDKWDNPCGHLDTYAAVLRESRERQLPPPPPLIEPVRDDEELSEPVALIVQAAAERRGMHAAQAALLLEQHGHTTDADAVRAEIKASRGHMSAKQAATFLRDRDRRALPNSTDSTSTRTHA
ncbi:hypothetical protein AB0903_07990 [Streptomyces sp. NPDC048389]|uniref:hypothetical protein n=1 Tax=Streptomyces sp. NPDC048389 TaxID=3154622 RepID=UPI003456D1D3